MNAPDDSKPDEVDVDHYYDAHRRKVRRLALGFVMLAVVVPLLLTAYVFRDPLERFARGEIDITGDPTFSYAPVDESVEGLEKIHADLLPSWLVAEANREAWGTEHADEKWAALQTELSTDPNLLEIATETKSILRANQEVEKFERLQYLMRSWSNYLSESGEPYLVQGNAVTTGSGSFFYVKSYKVEADVRLGVADKDHRCRVVRRLDSTNVRESYLGATSRGADGAIVLINRIYDFVLRDIWPILGGESNPEWAAWDESVRAELAQHLTDTQLGALERGWDSFAEIQSVYDAIEARRECGNRLVIIEPGHVGLSPRTLADLEGWATDDALDLCPSLKSDELTTLRDASARLRDDEEFLDALSALIAVLTQGVAVHEARHVADDVDHDGLVAPLPCSACDDRDGAPSRAELSAYLASFAWGPTPELTYFQACAATHGRGGPHARAMQILREELQHNCLEGPPEDLQERARALEASWFGRSERVETPKDYPSSIGLEGIRR